MSILEKYNQQECRQNSCPGCSWVLSEGRQWVLGSLFSPLHHCSRCEQSVPERKAVPGKILTLLLLSICWLSCGQGISNSWASQTSDFTRSSMPPRETSKATWGSGFFWCCQGGPPVAKTWAGGAVPGDPGPLQVTSCSHGTLSKGTSIVSKHPYGTDWIMFSGFQVPYSSMGRLSWVAM